MNKYYIIIILAALFTGCLDEQIDTPEVSIIPNTLHVAVGDTIDFKIDGYAENIVFYSGEFGNRYAYKDSFLVKAALEMSFGTLGTFHFAPSNNLSLWYSTNFVNFEEFDSGTKTPAEYWNDATWAQVSEAEFSSLVTWSNADLNSDKKFLFDTISVDFVKHDNVTFAFKFLSEGRTNGNMGIRNFKISAVSENLQAPVQIAGKADGWRSITLQTPEGKSPRWRDRDAFGWQLLHAGPSDKNLEMWLVLRSVNTNKTVFNIPADKGIAVKDYTANRLESFKYSYNKPGNYTASFLLTDGSKTGQEFESQLVEFNITVSE